MKRWQILTLSFFVIMFLNSCGLVLKERTISHNGIEKTDFGLPLIIYHSSKPFTSKLVILLSGDGGWMDFNNQLAVHFSKQGFNAIGFNCRTYFWHQRTPEQIAEDFSQFVRKYSKQWKSKHIILSGYSFGADVVPFLYNRLPEDLKNKVTAIQLLSPFLSTDFKVHISDLFNQGKDDRTYKVSSEIEKIEIPIYCFYGEQEEPKSLATINKKKFILRILPGDHRYIDGYNEIVASVRK